MNELQPILNLLGPKFAFLSAVFMFMGAIRVPLKFVSARIQRNLTARMAAAAASADTLDDQDFSFLAQRWYRVLAFSLDLVFSFKLPTHADFLALTQQQTINSGDRRV